MTREELLQIAKPILFNTEMVKAILEDRKTVTRRVVKLPSYVKNQGDGRYTLLVEGTGYVNQTLEEIEDYLKKPCKPGDVLYVRETWKQWPSSKNYSYKEDWERDGIADITKWKPSIHMPKEAARIFLKVTSVRVERLQDITEEQAEKEGEEKCIEVIRPDEDNPVTYIDDNGYFVLGFKNLWNSTIKKADIDTYGWDANPYVWVIEFERIKPD